MCNAILGNDLNSDTAFIFLCIIIVAPYLQVSYFLEGRKIRTSFGARQAANHASASPGNTSSA